MTARRRYTASSEPRLSRMTSLRELTARLAATGLTNVDLAPFPVGDTDMPTAVARMIDTLRP